MRLFVALDVPVHIKGVIIALQKTIEHANVCQARYTKPEQLHVTLQFLGDVKVEHIPAIQKALRSIKFTSFQACLGKLGVLPSAKHIRVIFIELIAHQLAALVREVKKQLAPFVQLEERDFFSHLTFARIKKIDDHVKLLALLDTIEIPEACFTVDAFVLKQSELTQEGAVHRVLETYSLLSITSYIRPRQ